MDATGIPIGVSIGIMLGFGGGIVSGNKSARKELRRKLEEWFARHNVRISVEHHDGLSVTRRDLELEELREAIFG